MLWLSGTKNDASPRIRPAAGSDLSPEAVLLQALEPSPITGFSLGYIERMSWLFVCSSVGTASPTVASPLSTARSKVSSSRTLRT